MKVYDKTMKWSTPPEQVMTNYLNKCMEFVNEDELFGKFKQDPDYTLVLEGSSRHGADVFFNELVEDEGYRDFFSNNLEEFRENDSLGSPTVYDYGEYGNFSLGTLKYIWNSSTINRTVGLGGVKKVVEIGGGYGGMCKAMSTFTEFDEYTLIDLPEPLALCDKYLSNFEELYPKLKFHTPDSLEGSDLSCDLLIADSSIAECNYPMQKYYLDNLILKANKGFIIYNSLHLVEQRAFYLEMVSTLQLKGYQVVSRVLHGSAVVELMFAKD
jgi:putative sugar O-methyltransferase